LRTDFDAVVMAICVASAQFSSIAPKLQ